MWGTVTCFSSNVAWLICATFDACKISVPSGTLDGMRVSASYWGVQGWEVNNTSGSSSGGSCFTAIPANSSVSIHHIIFANDIANSCPLNGLSAGNNSAAGVDYFAVLGSIAYGAGVQNTFCGSGISVYEPVAFDSAPGTHIYVAGNFSFGNYNLSGCFDGNGIIFDTFDGDQTGMAVSYSQQGVIDNNISVSNGSIGVVVEYNNAGAGPSHSTIYVRGNTTWGNNNSTNQFGTPGCGEIKLFKTLTTNVLRNIASTSQAGCYGDASIPTYSYLVDNSDGTSSVNDDVGWSAIGNFTSIVSSPGFTFGTNIFANPLFMSPAAPSAPSCGSFSSVPNCAATIIADFSPTSPLALGYGYQTPSGTPVVDPLYPQWLCTVTSLPVGLVTPGCATPSTGSATKGPVAKAGPVISQ